jgi:hypothetical protein
MKKNNVLFVLVLVVLAISQIACNVGANGIGKFLEVFF